MKPPDRLSIDPPTSSPRNYFLKVELWVTHAQVLAKVQNNSQEDIIFVGCYCSVRSSMELESRRSGRSRVFQSIQRIPKQQHTHVTFSLFPQIYNLQNAKANYRYQRLSSKGTQKRRQACQDPQAWCWDQVQDPMLASLVHIEGHRLWKGRQIDSISAPRSSTQEHLNYRGKWNKSNLTGVDREM